MEEIFKEVIDISYAQVILVDAQNVEIPEGDYRSGVIFGHRSVIVQASDERFVEVIVYKGTDDPGDIFLQSGEIKVGNQGLIIGDITSISIIEPQILWPPGTLRIRVYADGLIGNVNRITFVLLSDGINNPSA